MTDALLKKAMAVLLFFASIAMTFMILIIVIDVAGREFFNHPLTGAYELVEFCMGMLCPVSVTYCIYKEQDICVDLLYQHFPKGVRKLIMLFANTFVLIVGVLLLWQSWYLVQDILSMETTTPLLSLAMWPVAVCVFLSFLIMIPVLLRFLLNSFQSVENEDKAK